MRPLRDTKFDDRLSTAAKAREAMLARARERLPQNDPEVARRHAERAAIAAARTLRQAAREAEKRAATEARLAEERAAELAAAEAFAREEEEKAVAKRAELDKLATLLADQKAARDARYAARKARRK
jgi:hypothetical protein